MDNRSNIISEKTRKTGTNESKHFSLFLGFFSLFCLPQSRRKDRENVIFVL